METPQYLLYRFGARAICLADTTIPEYPWPSNLPLAERNQAIIDSDQRGDTLIAIAKDSGISKQRVHQIIAGE